MIPNRNKNIVVKTQFNIHGSRGRDAGKFVADYVSRDSATDKSMSYIPESDKIPEDGDGVAFTFDSTAISRAETLSIAEHVQELHETGRHAIQQMVISFDPDYLVEQGLVPSDVEILNKGDYRFQYDDIRLRHAVISGLQGMVDNEGYTDGRMISAIQHDTLHLHVHAVVYENSQKLGRERGYEEKGVLKQSSLNQLAYDLDRELTLTKTPACIVQARLIPEVTHTQQNSYDSVQTPTNIVADMAPIEDYLRLLEILQEEEDERQKEAKRQKELDDMADNVYESLELGNKPINQK